MDYISKIAVLLYGENGIYVIVNSNTTNAGYSGHCDLIINGQNISGAYTTPEGGSSSIIEPSHDRVN